jgi:hypothetical protein
MLPFNVNGHLDAICVQIHATTGGPIALEEWIAWARLRGPHVDDGIIYDAY